MQIEKAENITHSDEALRIAKLAYYEILDTPNESAFDQIAKLAAEIFDVPNAGICFQTAEDVFLKAQIGAKVEIPSKDDTIAFFASVPIQSPDGYVLGFIYAADHNLQVTTTQQVDMLKLLADMVAEKLESRIAIRRTFRAYDDRLHVLVHDLKNPMTTILLQSELLGRIPGIDEKVSLIAGKINGQSKRMIDNLNGILSNARKESHSFKPKKTKVDLNELIRQVTLDLNFRLKYKNQSVLIDIKNPLEIFGDIDKLKVVFGQLIDNAIKFSPKGKEIKISHQTADNEITIVVQDDGVGLTEEDLDKIFLKFAPLTAVASDGENTYGLGLITANALIDIHKGKLWAESDGKDKGATFYVMLPIK
jgi:signal transduction histidine kinase